MPAVPRRVEQSLYTNLPGGSTAADQQLRALLGDYARNEIQHAVVADLLTQVKAAMYSLTKASAKTLVAFVQGTRDGLPALEAEVLKVHQRVAEEAQEAILDAYDESLLGTPPYRAHALLSKNRRYAGGILRSVLASSSFVSYDEKGIYIGNTRELDARARQWRRLNYGAGGAAGAGAEVVTLRWSNQEFYMVEPGAARPAFRIPQGAWFGQEFYPVSELMARHRLVSHMTGRAPSSTIGGQEGILQRPRMTRGIRGRHWLGAGLIKIAEALPQGYNDAMKTLWKSGNEEVAKAVAQAGATRVGQTKITVSFTSRSD